MCMDKKMVEFKFPCYIRRDMEGRVEQHPFVHASGVRLFGREFVFKVDGLFDAMEQKLPEAERDEHTYVVMFGKSYDIGSLDRDVTLSTREVLGECERVKEQLNEPADPDVLYTRYTTWPENMKKEHGSKSAEELMKVLFPRKIAQLDVILMFKRGTVAEGALGVKKNVVDHVVGLRIADGFLVMKYVHWELCDVSILYYDGCEVDSDDVKTWDECLNRLSGDEFAPQRADLMKFDAARGESIGTILWYLSLIHI